MACPLLSKGGHNNVKLQSNTDITVRWLSPHRYWNSRAIWITQSYLPSGRGDIPAFTPAEAGTRVSDSGGMQGW